MLLQLSTKKGINIDTVTSWAVCVGRPGCIDVWFTDGDEQPLPLDHDESFQFLQYVTYPSPWLEVETRNRLLGIKETSGQEGSE